MCKWLASMCCLFARVCVWLCECVYACVCVKMAINVTKRKQWQHQQQQQRQQSRSQATYVAIYPRVSLAISSTILNTENNHWLCTRHDTKLRIRNVGHSCCWCTKCQTLVQILPYVGFIFRFPSSPFPTLPLSFSLPRLFYGLLKAAFLYISRAPHK